MNADDVWFRGSVGRVAALVVVLVVHVTAFVFVTLPTAPFRLHRLSFRLDSGNDLLVRLIDVSPHVADVGQQRSMIRRKQTKREKPDRFMVVSEKFQDMPICHMDAHTFLPIAC